MIKHTVCFKLKDNSEESCRKAAEVLRSMEGRVEQLRGIEVGVDMLHSDRSYDVLLQVLLDSPEDMEAYQRHPYHVNTVKAYMHAARAASVAVDYEI